MSLRTACLLTLFLAPVHADELTVAAESFVLDNGMRVTLHEDHSLPQVVINTWYAVGSRDERAGRTGFAHLFEHLMFMGTERVPGSQFDITMESGGGFNNATTSRDRTNYFSVGPSSLLPTLLWLDADRFDALARAMTQEKLDTQRGIVRNERRQTGENTPYGRARYVLGGMLYPKGHPYHHPVIGSHADLEAAQLGDVTGFFEHYYVPGNASLVVAGDFDPVVVRALLERTVGAVSAGPVPERVNAQAPVLTRELRGVTYDAVELPKLIMAWIAPAFLTPGDGAMDLLGSLLSGGPQTRLDRRLVYELGLAVDVRVYQASSELSSEFTIEVVATPDADRARIEAEVDAVLAEYLRAPADAAERDARAEELARVQVSMERGFLEGMQSLMARADAMNRYLHYWGVADGFQRDLDRWITPSAEQVRQLSSEVLGGQRALLWVLPAEGDVEQGVLSSPLDERPADFAKSAFQPPAIQQRTLSNGTPVLLVPQPGTRLFSGALVSVRDGSTSANPPGADALAARMLTSGAAGKDAVEFADAVAALGAAVDARASGDALVVSVDGLSSRLEGTLGLFADAVLAPNWAPADFEREHGLQLSAVRSRDDDASAVARLVSRRLVFPEDDPRAHPGDGYVGSLEALQLAAVRGLHEARWRDSRTELCFVGDFEPDALVAQLEERFAALQRPPAASRWSARASLAAVPPGRCVLVDRPGAQQTRIYLLSALGSVNQEEQATRSALDIALGGSFTSRLNMNLRERNRISYGAGSAIVRSGSQELMLATSAVQTDASARGVQEFMNEFAALAGGDLEQEELDKALETARTDAMQEFGSTSEVLAALVSLRSRDGEHDAWNRELRALDSVELDSANALAGSGLYDWSDWQVVLVGDAEAVRSQLSELGLPAPLAADSIGRLLD